jgi:hypothetical protein
VVDVPAPQPLRMVQPHNNMHPAVVMRRITSASTSWGLHNAIKACKNHMNAAHTSAALLRLAHLSAVEAVQDTQKALYTAGAAGNGTTTEGSVVNMTMASLRHRSTGGAPWRQAILAPEPPSSSTPAVPAAGGAMADSAAKLQLSAGTDVLSSASSRQSLHEGDNSSSGRQAQHGSSLSPTTLALNLLLAQVAGGAGELDSCGIASVISALGTLGVHDSGLVQHLLRAAEPQLHSFTPSQMSMLLIGLARLGIRPDNRWLGAFFQASAAQLERALSSGGGGASMPRLPSQKPPGAGEQQHQQASGMPEGTPIYQEQQQGLAEPAPQHSGIAEQRQQRQHHTVAAVQEQGAGTSQKTTEAWRDQQAGMVALCNMLWALSSLQCRPPYQWVGRALHLTQGHLSVLGPREHSCLLYSLGRLGFSPSHSWSHAELAQVMQQWVRQASSLQTNNSGTSAQDPTQDSASGPPGAASSSPAVLPAEPQRQQPSSPVRRQLWGAHELACSLWGLSRMYLTVDSDAASAFHALWGRLVNSAAPGDVVMVVDAVTHSRPQGSGCGPGARPPGPVIAQATGKALVGVCLTQVRSGQSGQLSAAFMPAAVGAGPMLPAYLQGLYC